MKNLARTDSTAFRLILIAVTAFAARVLVSLLFGENRTAYYEYMDIAQNLLSGKGYSWNEWGRAALQPTSFLPPVYVLWCALFMALLHGSYLPMYIAQALVAASGCVPAYLVGRRMFSERVGWVFAIGYAFYPELMYLHSRPTSEFLYVVLVLWILYLYAILRDLPSDSPRVARTAAWTGVLTGFTILVKEGASVVLAAVILALLISRRPFLRALKSCVLPLLVGTVVVMSPWIVRNAVVQGEFIPVRTGYGVTFWIANHPGATGTDKHPDGRYVLSDLPEDYADYMNRILPADEQDRDRVYRREGWRFVTGHPAEYLTLTAKRLWYFWWFDPTHVIARNTIYRLSWLVLLVLAIPGGFVAARRRQMDRIIPVIVLGYMVLYVPVIVLPRYRIIPVLFMLLLASYTLVRLWDWWQTRRWPSVD